MLPWLEGLPISQWVATSDWGYPLLLSAHSIGMAAVVGILVMLDLRVLGYARRIPLSAFDRLMPVAWTGFFLNLASGALLFMSMATRFVTNWPFLSKMGTILLGGAISWLLWRALRSPALATGTALTAEEPFATSPLARRLAVASMVVWLSAILFGRLIAYVLDQALLHGN